jgi:hypothetical protein
MLWLPNNGFRATPKSGPAEAQSLYPLNSDTCKDFRRISGTTKWLHRSE